MTENQPKPPTREGLPYGATPGDIDRAAFNGFVDDVARLPHEDMKALRPLILIGLFADDLEAKLEQAEAENKRLREDAESLRDLAVAMGMELRPNGEGNA